MPAAHGSQAALLFLILSILLSPPPKKNKKNKNNNVHSHTAVPMGVDTTTIPMLWFGGATGLSPLTSMSLGVPQLRRHSSTGSYNYRRRSSGLGPLQCGTGSSALQVVTYLCHHVQW